MKTPLTWFPLYTSLLFLCTASHLFEDNGLFIPHWIDGVVVLGGFGLQSFPPGVRRKSEHLHLYIHADPPVGQKLAWNHLHGNVETNRWCSVMSCRTFNWHCIQPLYLHREGVGYDAIHCVLCEWVEVFVWPSHELRLKSVAATAVVLKHEEVQLHG